MYDINVTLKKEKKQKRGFKAVKMEGTKPLFKKKSVSKEVFGI